MVFVAERGLWTSLQALRGPGPRSIKAVDLSVFDRCQRGLQMVAVFCCALGMIRKRTPRKEIQARPHTKTASHFGGRASPITRAPKGVSRLAWLSSQFCSAHLLSCHCGTQKKHGEIMLLKSECLQPWPKKNTRPGSGRPRGPYLLPSVMVPRVLPRAKASKARRPSSREASG